jgi:hypothetical protein
MRFNNFLIRTSFFLPLAIWSLLLSMMLIGILIDLFGATSLYFCTGYCAVFLGTLAIVVVSIIACQFGACWKKG